VISEPLWGTVKTDDSLWEMESRGGVRTLVVTLVKATAAAWDFLLKSEARSPGLHNACRLRGCAAARRQHTVLHSCAAAVLVRAAADAQLQPRVCTGVSGSSFRAR
jgi:hypothetical protein